MGIGKTMVEFFSEEMVARVWRYLNCRAAGLSEMMSLASLRALLAFCSPSAAITWNSSLRRHQELQASTLPSLWPLWKPQPRLPWLSGGSGAVSRP